MITIIGLLIIVILHSNIVRTGIIRILEIVRVRVV